MKRVAVTTGDINGIGPEIALKAACELNNSQTQFVLIGEAAVLYDVAAQLCLEAPKPFHPEERTAGVFIKQGDGPSLTHTPGIIDPAASRAAYCWLEEAVDGCLSEKYDALCTAPICKEGMHAAGIPIPGHTEFLAERTGTRRFAMLLMGGGLRVVLATRHVALRRVADVLSTEAIVEAVELVGEALPWLDAPHRRIGVCALNPHAGDGGVMGNEEELVIAPAIAAARRNGLDVSGPIPADVIFHQAVHGKWDAVVAMYHDQGLGPLKMRAFDSGINVTLGLPVIRTSPDHGTAFDIAGRGIARHESMVAALQLAADLCDRKNPWK